MNALVLKTSRPKGLVGSNPTLSATAKIGAWTPPAGRSVVYKGYALGPLYNTEGGYTPLVIDSDSFDASVEYTAGSVGLLYPAHFEVIHPGSSNTVDRFLKCAVIVKDPN